MDAGVEITLLDAAKFVGGKLVGPDAMVHRFCSLDAPHPGALAFVEHANRFDKSAEQRPSGLIVKEEIDGLDDIGQIIVGNPRLAFVKMMKYFHPPVVVEDDFRHPSAVVAEDAAVGEPVYIGPGCVVESGAVIEQGCRLTAQVYIGRDTRIGGKCLIHPGVKILHDVRIGERCIIGPGVVIGADGFGFVPEGDVIHKVPQVGMVIIGDDVEIGANCTIDRATLDATMIGDMTKLDNLVQVGHNVLIGKRVRMAGQVGIAGGVTLGDDIVVGGQAGIKEGVHLGNRIMVGGRAGVLRDLPDDMIVSGYPAREHRHQLKVEAAMQRLPKILKRFSRLFDEMGDEKKDRSKE